MILAKARLIGELDGKVKVGLSLPTGFDPEEVVEETVRGNGVVLPVEFRVEPRRGRLGDVFREFEVSFSEEMLRAAPGATTTLRITGKLRRGMSFQAAVPIPSVEMKPPSAS